MEIGLRKFSQVNTLSPYSWTAIYKLRPQLPRLRAQKLPSLRPSSRRLPSIRPSQIFQLIQPPVESELLGILPYRFPHLLDALLLPSMSIQGKFPICSVLMIREVAPGPLMASVWTQTGHSVIADGLPRSLTARMSLKQLIIRPFWSIRTLRDLLYLQHLPPR
jgi:hypothetical protein